MTFNLFKRKPDPQIVALLQRAGQLEADVQRLKDADITRFESDKLQARTLLDISRTTGAAIGGLTARVNKAELAVKGLAECGNCRRAVPLASMNGDKCHPCSS